jgi:hypothetical protein
VEAARVQLMSEFPLKPAAALKAPPAARHGPIGEWGFVEPHHKFAGQHHQGHKHATDHVTRLHRGTVRVSWRDPDGNEGVNEYTGPVYIEMVAERWHRFDALTDAEWDCIFARPSDKLLHEPYWAQIPPGFKAVR